MNMAFDLFHSLRVGIPNDLDRKVLRQMLRVMLGMAAAADNPK